jgi:septum formation protein
MTFSSARPDLSAPPCNFSLVPILLASASPRRAHILETLGIPFRVVSSAFQEPPPRPEDHAQPARYVEHLAREKVRGCGDKNPRSLVLTADTIVWHDGQILGKPQDEDDAVQTLQRLRGREHRVYTGVCLRHAAKGKGALNAPIEYSIAHETTTVRFREVSDSWIAAYVATGEPMDKAGSYGAQGKGAILVEAIEGDFWNVVGLPLRPLRELLEKAGAPIESFWK